MIRGAIIKLSKKEDLTYQEAYECMNEIMDDQASDIQKAAYLTALSLKGETIDEITASAKGMREHCVKLLNDQDVLEIVGTGGDGSNSFNISTTSSIVIASGGVKVAKHGNRAASSKSGAADCLEALGVDITINEKRSKELGTYMLLGIKKKEIAHLVVIENILLGILAFVLAIPIGFLFSQFVSLVIVNLLGIPKTLFISLNFVSIGLLIIYFLTIYVLVLLNLLRRISKMTIRDFLYFDKQNEKKMFRDSKKRNVIFVLSIILGAISLFLWNSRCTMDNFNKQETLTYLMVSVIMLIISIYGISTTCADMFLTVLLKNKKMKYQNDNLFVARTFASKARTMSFTFGTLSMLILISLLALNYSSINKASYDISVNLNAPYDVQLFDDKQVFDEYIRVIEEEYTIDNTIEYDIYKEPNHQVQNFFQSEYYDFDPVLKLSDYNRLLELRKMPLLSLNDNEYYIVTNSKFAYEVEDNKDIETITVANKNLKLKGYDTKSYWNSITNTGRFVVVLPDKYVQGLEVSENHLIIDTKEDTDAELENKIKEDMQHQLVKVDENGEINDESYRVNVRGAEIEQQKAMVAIVASLFMYIAFILISAVGTILAVQSLSDSTKYKYRYLTLRRLGINDKSLFKTIRKQLLILFCVPAISAILCSFVMMSSLNNVYQQILGDKHLYLMYFGLNLIIFFLIYSIYWIATYIGFKRNINEES